MAGIDELMKYRLEKAKRNLEVVIPGTGSVVSSTY